MTQKLYLKNPYSQEFNFTQKVELIVAEFFDVPSLHYLGERNVAKQN